MAQKIHNCPPDPASHFQSIKSIGYDINRAISDIIDNSISANAKNIYIIHHFDNEKTKIAILDDGDGMNKDELINGMRLNSKNPVDDREDQDLGRFGLGLKSASFSQCDILTVRSKKNGGDCTASWDLDLITKDNNYSLILNPERKDGEFVLELLDKFNSGTIVLWEKLNEENFQDPNINKNKQNFNSIIAKMHEYIGMIFHRFIGLGGGVNISITTIDGFTDPANKPISVKAWDPYLMEKSQKLPDEVIDNDLVVVTPYILPYHTKISQKEQIKLEGINGQLNHQGFYVYRNKRLIIPGTWFGFFAKHNQYNTVRIRIDLPNNRDHEWMLDISKSEVSPPALILPKLKAIARNATGKAKETLAFKGRARARKAKHSKDLYIWNVVDFREGKKGFQINRNHHLVRQIIDAIVIKENQNRVKDLLTLIEKNLPIVAISNEFTTDQKSVEIEHSDSDYLFNNTKKDPLTKFREIYISFRKQGRSEEYSFNQTIAMEPFIHNASVYESLKDALIKEVEEKNKQ